jgi:outer membrane protein assembly factor BamB
MLTLAVACSSTGGPPIASTDDPAVGAVVAQLTPPVAALVGAEPDAAATEPLPDPDPAPAAVGLLTFRGNPTRSFYGSGPLPAAPLVLWQYPRLPQERMCSMSTVGRETSKWCGTGWTGQPAVVERDGRTWVIFGAYDGAVHFLDGATGRRLLPDFRTGDIVKGSVTVDPDGYPLVYVGSRDNAFRVIAIDRAVPTELWRIEADDVSPALWNDDWDGSGLISDGYLLEGGENSQFHVVELNRSYGADGLAAVDPVLAFHAPGWDAELLAGIADHEVSIEGSVALAGGVAWFANSGGLVQGWDVSGLADGTAPERVFRFWMGDDVDATVVVDADGMLYVGAEWERHTARARLVGQIVKLDPSRPNPVVWSVADRVADVAGVWATPALWADLVIVATDGGRLLGIDRATGRIRWTKALPRPLWQSPVVVDGVLLQGDCHGVLHAYDLADTAVDPPELWRVQLPGCIESTPAVWNGRIYVGTREGHLYAIGAPGT